MAQLAPTDPSTRRAPSAGTRWRSPRGIATLDLARTTDPYPRLEATADVLTRGIDDGVRGGRHPATINRAGSLFSVFFTASTGAQLRRRRERPTTNATRGSSTTCWTTGSYLPPSGYELWTLSTTHGPEETERILGAVASFRD